MKKCLEKTDWAGRFLECQLEKNHKGDHSASINKEWNILWKRSKKTS
jgi:hypothetical protein